MPVLALDHLNLRTAQLDVMVSWYERVLGLTVGPRPPFPFRGAWMYAGDHALVHLVEIGAPPDADHSNLALEHGAFRATDFTAFLATLTANGVRYHISPVPDFPIVQVNIWDPDENHLHVDFPADQCGDFAD